MQREGLKPPQAVLDATAAYLEAEDAIAAWIDERCERDRRRGNNPPPSSPLGPHGLIRPASTSGQFGGSRKISKATGFSRKDA